MRRGKLIAGLVLVLAAITVGSLTVSRWVTRPVGNEHSAAQPTPVALSSNTQATVPAAVVPLVVRGDAMARAFRSGRLPTPLA